MGRSGDVFKEGGGTSVLHGEVNIAFNLVGEGGYVCEVDDAVVFHVGDGKGECAVGVFHGQDWDHNVVRPCVHFHIVRMVPLVVEDGLAQGHCGVNLGVGRVSGFQYLRLESVGFRRERGKASKIHFYFGWSGSGSGSRTVIRSVAAYCSFEP